MNVWLIGLGALIGANLLVEKTAAAATNATAPAEANALLEYERNTISVFNQVSPYVIFVNNIQRVQDFLFNSYEVPAGAGTGFIWDDKGHIVTNFHVVQGAKKISITIQGGKSVGATVVGVEPRKDIAVLKLDSVKELPPIRSNPPITIADSSKLQVGQKALAIGNPFGLDRTLTTGVISALGRQVPGIGGVTIRDMVQTDASINPGNSGGPLLDSSGHLIGMNSVIYSGSGSSAGIGFAVPSNTIKRVVEQLIKHGRIVQPGLGVHRLPDDISQRLGVQGVIVAEVLPNTPAAKSGMRGTTRMRSGEIQLGDIIVDVDGKKVKSYDDLYNALEGRKVGDDVDVVYLRDQQRRTVKIRLVDVAAEG